GSEKQRKNHQDRGLLCASGGPLRCRRGRFSISARVSLRVPIKVIAPAARRPTVGPGILVPAPPPVGPHRPPVDRLLPAPAGRATAGACSRVTRVRAGVIARRVMGWGTPLPERTTRGQPLRAWGADCVVFRLCPVAA